MRHRIAAVDELSEADIEAWRDLADHAIEPNPLFEPECLLPAAKYLSNDRRIYLVIAEDDGQFYGCFPIGELRGGIPPKLKVPFLSRPAVTTLVRRLRYDGTPLLRAERSVETAGALLKALATPPAKLRAKFLVLESMSTDGSVSACFHKALDQLELPSLVLHAWTRPVARRDGEEDDYGASNRKKLTKLTRKISEESGKDVKVFDASDDASMIEYLVKMEAAGYKSQKDVAMAAHPGETEWFVDMCSRFRAEGRLVLQALAVGDEIVALQLMLRARDCLFGIQSVYDENFARFSPGIVLHRAFIDQFYSSLDARMKDTCTFEGNSTLLRLYPHLRSIETRVIAVGGRYDRLLLRAFSATHRIFGPDSEVPAKTPKLRSIASKVLRRMGLSPA